MSRKQDSLISGLILATGAIIGIAGALLFKESQPKHAGLVLDEIKKDFSKKAKVKASWIDYDPTEYHSFDSRPLVYQGGITVEQDGQTKVYQFVADIYSGDIIDIFQVSI